MQIVICKHNALGCKICNSVNTYWVNAMVLFHWQMERGAVLSACSGEDNLCIFIILSNCLHNYQCAFNINREVLHRILDTIDVIYLTCKMENKILLFDEMIH